MVGAALYEGYMGHEDDASEMRLDAEEIAESIGITVDDLMSDPVRRLLDADPQPVVGSAQIFGEFRSMLTGEMDLIHKVMWG